MEKGLEYRQATENFYLQVGKSAYVDMEVYGTVHPNVGKAHLDAPGL